MAQQELNWEQYQNPGGRVVVISIQAEIREEGSCKQFQELIANKSRLQSNEAAART